MVYLFFFFIFKNHLFISDHKVQGRKGNARAALAVCPRMCISSYPCRHQARSAPARPSHPNSCRVQNSIWPCGEFKLEFFSLLANAETDLAVPAVHFLKLSWTGHRQITPAQLLEPLQLFKRPFVNGSDEGPFWVPSFPRPRLPVDPGRQPKGAPPRPRAAVEEGQARPGRRNGSPLSWAQTRSPRVLRTSVYLSVLRVLSSPRPWPLGRFITVMDLGLRRPLHLAVCFSCSTCFVSFSYFFLDCIFFSIPL